MNLRLKIAFKVCLFGLLISCTNEIDRNKQDEITGQPDKKESSTEKESETNLVKEKTISILSVSDIDFYSIKKRFENSYTSGILLRKDGENYLPNTQVAFYGVYFFIQPESELPFIGKAVVACQEQDGWDYSNELEELVEFIIFSNDLNPFIERVRIGEAKMEIIRELGNDFKQAEDNLFFTDTMGNVATILITKDTVQAIRVGRYEKPQEVSPIKLKW